jgi:hypothetical protein
MAPIQAMMRSRSVAPARMGTKRRKAMASPGASGEFMIRNAAKANGFESQTNPKISQP